MFSPATKGWIQKYLELFEQNIFESDLNFEINQQQIHTLLVSSGLSFGFASHSIILQENVDKSRWTNEEQLKLLLFEAILFLYISKIGIKNFSSEAFLSHLSDFYQEHSAYSIKKLFTFFIKETPIEKLETILSKRVGIAQNIIESTFEINSFSNTLMYLDLVLYSEYLNNNNQHQFERYARLAKTALRIVILASKADNIVVEREKLIFKVFLESANLPRSEEKIILEDMNSLTSLNEVKVEDNFSWLFKKYLLDLATLVIYSSDEVTVEEEIFLQKLARHLGFSEEDSNDSIIEVQRFVLQNANEIHFLKDASGVEKYYSGVSEKWTKILGRNKDKLAVELRQSKELVGLITKSTTQELTKDEKEKVKSQFKDLVKSVPALTIFLLPGGAVLLPVILKVIPSLVPTAFRDNELDNKKSN